MLRNKNILTILIVLTSCLLNGQKQQQDTIYIYEEVIVHDTIYIEKPLEKLKFETVTLSFDSKTNKSILQILNNGKTFLIPIQKTIIDNDSIKSLFVNKKKRKYYWEFGIKLDLTLKKNTLFNDKLSTGLGAGIYFKRNLFHPKFFIGSSITYAQFFKSINLKPSQTNSPLSGYYFFDSQPKFISNLSNQHNQVSFSSQLYWKIKKLALLLEGFIR